MAGTAYRFARDGGAYRSTYASSKLAFAFSADGPAALNRCDIEAGCFQ